MAYDFQSLVTQLKELLDELERQETLSEQGKKLLTNAKSNADNLSALFTPLANVHNADVHEKRKWGGSVDTSDRLQEDTGVPSKSHGKELLLLAESNDDTRISLMKRLASEYRVISVTNGIQALERAKALNPDIIVSDILIPALRGDQVCRILKSSMETSHIPVILLTALRTKEDIILGLEAGADDYITKPFDFTVLKTRIRNILNNREKLRKMLLASEAETDNMNYTNQLDKVFLDKAILIIEKELTTPEFSINDFCRALGMSRTSVYNKIKTLTNQGPNDFIRMIRLNKARKILKSKKYPIAEVAWMVGFSDPKYFSTCFKKQFGTSPSKTD
ncbi:MAG: helix-turn-helix domain-containing protein [Tannerellaceae bacterium]|jgi:DNA-binding response OmpR family regulator|nr:helix-turn-helix domain-containing protein [Tannerellaceae bacterium]